MKTNQLMTVLVMSLAGAKIAHGQGTPAQTAPPAPWSIGEMKFSGLIDGYYSHNFNNPASGFSTLRNFDVRSRSFAINMLEFSMFHDPEPIGFRLDLGFGRAWEVFHATDPGRPDIVRYFPQAYVSVKPKDWGGFQFDFGKFVTSAGAELTENNLSWTYGRGYLYTNGPYYHFGARMTKPLASNFAVGFQLVNGWNNVEDNNSGKTVGFTTAWTGKKVSWFNNYYVGPEKAGTNDGRRHFYDTVLNFSPSGKAAFYVNFDYGRENKAFGDDAAEWVAVGVAGRFQTTERTALTLRYENYKDKDGFITSQSQTLNSFTVTGEYKWAQGLLSRLEYRRDWSDKPFFERGSQGSPLNIPGLPFTPGPWKNQDTLTLGFVAFFGPK
jgi:hypothetical protein